MSDYISRDKVAQAFEDAVVDLCEDYGGYYGCEWGFSRDAVRKIVAELPAADVDPVVHAQWKDDTCTNCGYGVQPWNNTGYCPSCGARMDKEVNT